MTEFAAYAALFGLFLTTLQIVVSTKQSVESRRPVLVLSLILTRVDKDERLYLHIENVGITPATNVIIDFENGKSWNWVSSPQYPFLAEQGGIPVLGPGKSIKYFLGVVKPSGQLAYLKNATLFATASSSKGTLFGCYKDSYSHTLRHQKFESKPE